jgi:hypothetical protein
MTPIARLPAICNGEAVMIVGFDATHALCVFGDGHLSYVEHSDLAVTFFRDLEAGFWFEYGRSDGEADALEEDGVQSPGAPGEAEALPRPDGRSDDDVVEVDR